MSESLRQALSSSSQSSEITQALEGTKPIDLLIWTTTPWSLPSNMAIAVHPELEYCLVQAESQDSHLFIIGAERVEALTELKLGLHPTAAKKGEEPAASGHRTTFGPLREIARFRGRDLIGSEYSHCFLQKDKVSRPVVPADYVTAETGTGLVHTAPAHGAEDYENLKSLGLLDGEELISPINDEGRYTDEAPEPLRGLDVLGAGARKATQMLHEAGALLSEVPQRHRYPCDWRSKQPVIVRATWQWFANLDKIKGGALKALQKVDFVPSNSRNRLEAFVQGRNEWCISRQRAWGLPIPVLYDEATGEPLLTPENVEHIAGVLHEKGTDHWWIGNATEFVAPQYQKGGRWIKGTDTIDVWFDSGSSWAVLQDALGAEGTSFSEVEPIADVYLEGSDQHRGWFQSSLLTKVASSSDLDAASAPYKHVITHGMVVDKDGKKMSKSIGNVVSPLDFIDGSPKAHMPAYGADVLRFWVARSDYTREAPVGAEIIKKASDALRKLRNTARFMLANLKNDTARPIDDVQLFSVSGPTTLRWRK